jgi:hypothetical protein
MAEGSILYESNTYEFFIHSNNAELSHLHIVGDFHPIPNGRHTYTYELSNNYLLFMGAFGEQTLQVTDIAGRTANFSFVFQQGNEVGIPPEFTFWEWQGGWGRTSGNYYEVNLNTISRIQIESVSSVIEEVSIYYSDGGPALLKLNPNSADVSITIQNLSMGSFHIYAEDAMGNHRRMTLALTGDESMPYYFTDVHGHNWFFNSVSWVGKNGIMQGVEAHEFAPNSSLTRGMLVTILGRFSNANVSGYNNTFPDVDSGAFYAQYIAWAKANGYVSGYEDGTFGPGNYVTRQEMAAIIARYCAENYENYYSLLEAFKLDYWPYSDEHRISDWAKSSVFAMQVFGLMQGDESNLFNPNNSITRAQTAIIIFRLAQLLSPESE